MRTKYEAYDGFTIDELRDKAKAAEAAYSTAANRASKIGVVCGAGMIISGVAITVLVLRAILDN